MAVQVQWRRGTTAQHTTFIGATAEVTVDTDKKVVVVHDGTTAGGFPAAKESDITALQANRVEKTSNTGSAKMPVGTTAQRDGSPQDGWTRVNSDSNKLELYLDGQWQDAAPSGIDFYSFYNFV